MSSTIAVVSNNKTEQQDLAILLEKEGYKSLLFSEINQKNIDIISNISPEIIILDLDLASTDGIEVCYHLKSEKQIASYIVVWSNRTEEYIELEAFKVGADDYIVKTINRRVLLKKLKAILKHAQKQSVDQSRRTLTYKDIMVDVDRYVVQKGDETLSLPRKEFEMLILLLKNPKKVYSREDIYRNIWKSSNNFNPRIIDVHIRKIREKIGDTLIKTVKGVGYKLMA